MAKPIDRLLKLLESKNIAEQIDEDQQRQIVDNVLTGYDIDDRSRQTWLDINQEAMQMVKHCENDSLNKNDPIYKMAKVVYPLLAPAIIQLASRLIGHIVRNDKVVEIAIIGKDEQIPDPQSIIEAQKQLQQIQQQAQQQPLPPEQLQQVVQQIQQNIKYIWKKQALAERAGKYLNYKVLIESDTWLKDTHKLCHILASWGTAFRQISYDPICKIIDNEVLSPADVIINHNITSLDKARRITICHAMTKNEIIEQIRAGYFLDIDVDELKSSSSIENKNDPNETNPVFNIICQNTYLDLDEDGYAEPYKVYVIKDINKLVGIYPAFKINTIESDEKTGKINKIKPTLDIIDYHLIDDPEGKFYSIGLNYLLSHQNIAITAVQRELLDAGALSNAASCTGFITNAFQPRERHLEFDLGEFKQIDVNPNVNPQQHIIPLPAKEPSQVLLQMLQLLIQSGEKTGFITDVLTGDIQGQNVPATTMLAMVEQSTRAFKPVIQKLYISEKKEFKRIFELTGDNLNIEEYAKFCTLPPEVCQNDFNELDLEIAPVADPTQSSEAHKYAKLQSIMQLFQTQAIGGMNVQANLLELYKGLEFENPEQLIMAPQPPPPDPKMMELQLKQQQMQIDAQISMKELEIKQIELQLEQMKLQAKGQEIGIKQEAQSDKRFKIMADTNKALLDHSIKEDMVDISKEQVQVAKAQVLAMREKTHKDHEVKKEQIHAKKSD